MIDLLIIFYVINVVGSSNVKAEKIWGFGLKRVTLNIAGAKQATTGEHRTRA